MDDLHTVTYKKKKHVAHLIMDRARELVGHHDVELTDDDLFNILNDLMENHEHNSSHDSHESKGGTQNYLERNDFYNI